MDEIAERKRFEEWVMNHAIGIYSNKGLIRFGKNAKELSGEYMSGYLDAAWQGFKAGRELAAQEQKNIP